MAQRPQSPYDASPPVTRRAKTGTRRRGGNGDGGSAVGRFLLVLALWLGVCWGTIGALLAPELRDGWLTIVAAAIVTTLPLPVMLWARRRGRYPGAFFR